jgi:hypothetical protein
MFDDPESTDSEYLFQIFVSGDEASLCVTRSRPVNIQKARAARKRAPLPWRSGMESRIIEQLVWQWWMDNNSGQWSVHSGQKRQQLKGSEEWTVVSGQKSEMQILRRSAPQNDNSKNSGEKKQKQVPHRHPATAAGRLVTSDKKRQQQVPHTATVRPVRNDNVKNNGQWTVNSSAGSVPTTANPHPSQQQIPATAGRPHTATMRPVRNDNSKGKAASSSGYAGIREADRRTPYGQRPWAKLRVARFLGVSHTWVNKLVRKFEADP